MDTLPHKLRFGLKDVMGFHLTQALTGPVQTRIAESGLAPSAEIRQMTPSIQYHGALH